MKYIFKAAIAAIATLIGMPASAAGAKSTTVNHPRWSQNAVIYEVNTRQFTPEGTFDAFAKHLPRLKELGVDILWFMPIHPISEVNRKGTLGSYYAAQDYTAVNPEFGDLESFKNTVRKAHELGMKVIIDWVPNHTGCDNAWVSEHPDFYQLNENGKMYGPYDWTDVYQLDYNNKDMRRAMTDAMLFWIREADIDGFRCDVAGRVPVDFWNDCRRELEAAKGENELFMLAEATEPFLVEHAFDMTYNWPMKDLQNAIAATLGANNYVSPGKTEPHSYPAKTGADIATLLEQQAADYPAGAYMMNMVTNHDLNSWEGTEYDRYSTFLPAMTVLSYILPGMPLIYTGQEAALDRALEFFEKDPVVEFVALAQPGSRASQSTAMLKALNSLKHSSPQLAAGLDNTTVTTGENPGHIAISRTLDGKTVTALLNLSNDPYDIHEPLSKAITARTFGHTGPATAVATLQPGEAAVITY